MILLLLVTEDVIEEVRDPDVDPEMVGDLVLVADIDASFVGARVPELVNVADGEVEIDMERVFVIDAETVLEIKGDLVVVDVTDGEEEIDIERVFVAEMVEDLELVADFDASFVGSTEPELVKVMDGEEEIDIERVFVIDAETVEDDARDPDEEPVVVIVDDWSREPDEELEIEIVVDEVREIKGEEEKLTVADCVRDTSGEVECEMVTVGERDATSGENVDTIVGENSPFDAVAILLTNVLIDGDSEITAFEFIGVCEDVRPNSNDGVEVACID